MSAPVGGRGHRDGCRTVCILLVGRRPLWPAVLGEGNGLLLATCQSTPRAEQVIGGRSKQQVITMHDHARAAQMDRTHQTSKAPLQEAVLEPPCASTPAVCLLAGVIGPARFRRYRTRGGACPRVFAEASPNPSRIAGRGHCRASLTAAGRRCNEAIDVDEQQKKVFHSPAGAQTW